MSNKRLIPSQRLVPGAPLAAPKLKADSEKTSLFDGVSPGNVGNVFQIPPSNSGPGNLLNSYGTPVRVLEINGEDRLGGIVCVSLQQETIIERALSTIGTAAYPEGPLVGIVEFGAGAGRATIEFDIPSPTIAPGNVLLYQPAFPTITPPGGYQLPVSTLSNGILITLPASSIRVYVRNDAHAPYLIDPPSPATPLNSINLLPGTVRVHATYGQRPFQSRLTRTYPICARTGAYTSSILAGQGIRIGIPPYAKRVYFPRRTLGGGGSFPPPSPAIQIEIGSFGAPGNGNIPFRGSYVIPAGSDGNVEIFPMDTIIDIYNPGPDEIADMVVVFELAI